MFQSEISALPASVRKRIVLTPSGCWIWTDYKDSAGYGIVGVAGKLFKVHRLIYELFAGRVVEGYELHHVCKNKTCCNPEHLTLLTRPDHRAAHRGMRYAKKTHCVHGHLIDGWKANGNRYCRYCHRAHARARQQKIRAQKKSMAAHI